MGEAEKRTHRRTTVHYPVRATPEGGAAFGGTVENLGAHGALVSTPDLETPLEVGGRIALAIEMPDGGTLEAHGEILRLDQEFAVGDIRRSIAVRFDVEIAI